MKWFSDRRFSPGTPDMCPSCSRVVHGVGLRAERSGLDERDLSASNQGASSVSGEAGTVPR